MYKRQPYVKTAKARGVRPRVMIFGHALRNAMLPVVTIAGDQAAGMINGAVIAETVFGFPGIGKLMIDSIMFRDFAVIQAAVMITALATTPYAEAVGAYLISAAAFVLLGLSGWFERLIRLIPPGVAAGLLSGRPAGLRSPSIGRCWAWPPSCSVCQGTNFSADSAAWPRKAATGW